MSLRMAVALEFAVAILSNDSTPFIDDTANIGALSDEIMTRAVQGADLLVQKLKDIDPSPGLWDIP